MLAAQAPKGRPGRGGGEVLSSNKTFLFALVLRSEHPASVARPPGRRGGRRRSSPAGHSPGHPWVPAFPEDWAGRRQDHGTDSHSPRSRLLGGCWLFPSSATCLSARLP